MAIRDWCAGGCIGKSPQTIPRFRLYTQSLQINNKSSNKDSYKMAVTKMLQLVLSLYV